MQGLSPYKMQEIVDKEIDDLLEMGVTRGVKRLHNICMFKGSDEIQSYAIWHGELRLHI